MSPPSDILYVYCYHHHRFRYDPSIHHDIVYWTLEWNTCVSYYNSNMLRIAAVAKEGVATHGKMSPNMHTLG